MATASLNQTKSSISAQFEVVQQEQALFTVEIPFNYPGYHAEIYEQGSLQYSISWDTVQNMQRKRNKEAAIYVVLDAEGNAIGQMSRIRSKSWGGYYYFTLALKGEEYQMYEVGLGKQGIKLPVY